MAEDYEHLKESVYATMGIAAESIIEMLDEVYASGYDEGQQKGYDAGYDEGLVQGKAERSE